MRQNPIDRASGPTYQFMEAKWSVYPFDCVKDGEPQKKGGPISWKPAEVFAGEMYVEKDGEQVRLVWEDLAAEPGWCKLDWVTVDSDTGGLANASNVIDPTWESPDGDIVPLDGYLDAYFQEVYLDAGDLPTFTKVVSHVSGDALDDYVDQLEHEVQQVPRRHPQLRQGRQADVQRLPLQRAVPRGGLRARALRRADHDALPGLVADLDAGERRPSPGRRIPEENVRAQADELVMTVVQALDGVQEAETVDALLRLRTALEAADDTGADPEAVADEIEAAKTQLVNLVNNFFRDRLSAVPSIKDYMDSLATS